VDANWKTAAENFCGDGYHISSTHGSARQLGIDTTASSARNWGEGYHISCRNGHGMAAWICPPDDAGPWFAQPVIELANYMKSCAAEIEGRLGAVRARKVVPSAGTVFPNFSVHWQARTIRVWHPRGPQKMEIWSWAIVDRAAPPEIKDLMRFASQYRFSPTGVFEQDDVDNWQECTRSGRGVVARRHTLNTQMGLGHERFDEDLQAWTSDFRLSESNYRQFYRRWAELMTAKSWAEVETSRARS
jgi:phenylpropionate dioxygenase-like ring-hydroxylating dioxygenase large terminal subunit